MHAGLNSYFHKLDERGKKKLGRNAARVVKRTYGSPREGPPPKKLPAWMVAEEYQQSSAACSLDTSPTSCDTQPSVVQSTPTTYRPSDHFWSASRSLINMYSFEDSFGSVTEV